MYSQPKNETYGPIDVSNIFCSNCNYKIKNLEFSYESYVIEVYGKIVPQNIESKRDEWKKSISGTFRTAPRAPMEPPTTEIDAFSLIENDKIGIFWTKIPYYKQNGENFRYVIKTANRSIVTLIQQYESWAKFECRTICSDLIFEIYSENKMGRSNASIVYVPSGLLPPPMNIINRKISRNSYELLWTPPNNTIPTNYTILSCMTIKNSPKCGDFVHIEHANSNHTKFQIQTSQSTDVSISARSENSSSGLFWAKNLLVEFDWDEIGPYSLAIKWDIDTLSFEDNEMKFLITYCPITIKLRCKERKKEIRVDAIENRCNITGLFPFTMYEIELTVLSTDIRINGTMSETKYKHTASGLLTPPQNFHLLNVSNTSATLYWEMSEIFNDLLIYYDIYLNENVIQTEFQSGSKLTHKIDGLYSYTNYSVHVDACTTKRCSNSTNSLQFKTLVGVPSAPATIEMDFDEYEIVWTAPKNLSGNIDYYELRINYHDNGKNYETKVKIRDTKCTLINYKRFCSYKNITLSIRAVNIRDNSVITANLDGRCNFLNSDDDHETKFCKEERKIHEVLNVDDIFVSDWTQSPSLICHYSEAPYLSVLFVISIIGSIVYGFLMAYKRWQRMKDIAIDLPMELSDLDFIRKHKKEITTDKEEQEIKYRKKKFNEQSTFNGDNDSPKGSKVIIEKYGPNNCFVVSYTNQRDEEDNAQVNMIEIMTPLQTIQQTSGCTLSENSTARPLSCNQPQMSFRTHSENKNVLPLVNIKPQSVAPPKSSYVPLETIMSPTQPYIKTPLSPFGRTRPEISYARQQPMITPNTETSKLNLLKSSYISSELAQLQSMTPKDVPRTQSNIDYTTLPLTSQSNILLANRFNYISPKMFGLSLSSDPITKSAQSSLPISVQNTPEITYTKYYPEVPASVTDSGPKVQSGYTSFEVAKSAASNKPIENIESTKRPTNRLNYISPEMAALSFPSNSVTKSVQSSFPISTKNTPEIIYTKYSPEVAASTTKSGPKVAKSAALSEPIANERSPVAEDHSKQETNSGYLPFDAVK